MSCNECSVEKDYVFVDKDAKDEYQLKIDDSFIVVEKDGGASKKVVLHQTEAHEVEDKVVLHQEVVHEVGGPSPVKKDLPTERKRRPTVKFDSQAMKAVMGIIGDEAKDK
jgi:hypothetical protein